MSKSLKRGIYKLYSQLLFQRLVIYVINTFSLFMLGGISSVYMASSNLANQVFIIVSLAVAGIAEGSGVLIAQYIGKRDNKSINEIVSYSLFTAAFFGLAISIVVYLNSTFFMSIFTNDPEMIQVGQSYLKIASISYVFYSISTVTFAILRSFKIVNVAIISSIIACFVNIVLSLSLVHGYGVEGVAFASTVSRIIEFVIMVSYMYIRRNKLGLLEISVIKLNKDYRNLYYRTLYPLMLNETMWSLGDSIIIVIFGRLGQDFVTAQSMYSMLSQFTGILLSINVVTSIFIGNAIGEKNDLLVDQLHNFFLKISVIVGLVGSVIMLTGSYVVPTVYGFNETTNNYIRQILMVAAIIEVFKSLQLHYMMGIFRGAGDVKFILANDMTFLWLYAVPICYISAIVFGFEPWAVIALTRSDQILKYFSSRWRFRSNKWRTGLI